MKITESTLRRIIREEIKGLEEVEDGDHLYKIRVVFFFDLGINKYKQRTLLPARLTFYAGANAATKDRVLDVLSQMGYRTYDGGTFHHYEPKRSTDISVMHADRNKGNIVWKNNSMNPEDGMAPLRDLVNEVVKGLEDAGLKGKTRVPTEAEIRDQLPSDTQLERQYSPKKTPGRASVPPSAPQTAHFQPDAEYDGVRRRRRWDGISSQG